MIGKEKIAASNFIGLLQPLLIIISLALLIFFTGWRNIYTYIFSLYISFGVSLIISYIYVIRLFGKVKITTFRENFRVMGEMFRYGIMNQVAHITQMLSFRMSFYVIDKFLGEGAVGIYSNGISLAESVWLISKSISMVQYARIANSDDRDYSRKLTMQLVKASTVLSLIILIPLLVLPSGFYRFIFGEGFSDVGIVIRSLSGGVIIYNISILLGHYFSGTGRYHINAIASTAGMAVAAILFFTLIPRFGVAGAGYATSVSYLFTTAILLYYYRKENPGNFMKSLQTGDDWKLLQGWLSGFFSGQNHTKGK
jgi:O-antigen/teichoic acid export membrane protein